ncbi:flavin reductase family protein [Streptomyces sp. NPDC059456]|uniref:flavin reductase family protein n=1 Tax=Streptomyces sp. NPDC059456 TaxID=3346838 RepID=UPI0036CE19D4
MNTQNPAAPPATRTVELRPHRYEDADEARRALRRLASAVTVLTVDGGAGARHGTTASSVVAVSREPLILGVCLSRTSAFTRLALRAGTFSVNVLGVGQGDVAGRFADPERPSGDAQFAGLAWTTDPLSGAPLLDGSLAHLSCRLLDRHQVGDHDLLLAEVTAGVHARATPMLSFAGRLHATTSAEP